MLELHEQVEPKKSFSLLKDENFKKFDDALYDFRPGTMELRNRIEADFRGRFDSAFVLKGTRKVRISRGYGEGQRAQNRLVLESVSKVSVTPKP